MSSKKVFVDSLIEASNDLRDLSVGFSVPIASCQNPLEFYRDFVAPNRPCIFTSLINDWDGLSKWSNEYLSNKIGKCQVTVDVTPNGKADSIVSDGFGIKKEPVFVTPIERKMEFDEFLKLLEESRANPELGVPYAQHQQSSLSAEYSLLVEDAAEHIPFATEAFGGLPEAVNLWIGDERSETTFHKDHYENMYVVVKGEKHFTLLPPIDLPRMYIKNYPAAKFVQPSLGKPFEIQMGDPERLVPWSPVNPYPPAWKMDEERKKFPLYFEGTPPITCTVKAGEVLYLPSMWFHYVRQSPDEEGRTIAVNFWYDMHFDIKFAYFDFLQKALQSLPEDKNEDNIDE